MPIFHYKAARPTGMTVESQVEAADEKSAQIALEREGLILLSLESQSTSLRGFTWQTWPGNKISLQEFLIFNQELLALLKAGLPVLQTWDLLIERADRETFQRTLSEIREEIRGGSSISDAMGRHLRTFSDLYIGTIQAGEQSGNLSAVLQRYVAYLKLMISLRQKVVKALAYPVFLIVVGVAVIAFLLVYVMPTFVSVYGESARSLPIATQLLLELVDWVQKYLVFFLALGLAGVIGYHAYRSTSGGRCVTDRLVLSIPGIGPILSYHYTVLFAQTLAIVLASGMPLVDAMRIASGAVSNAYIVKGLHRSVDQVREGVPLAKAMAEQRVMPKLAIAMIGVGEETGSLETMLRDIGEFYEGTLDLKLTQLTTWIEPVLLLAMGLIVGTIVVIMYLPVFQMAGTVQ